MKNRQHSHKWDLLRSVSLFRLCSDKELQDVCSLCDEVGLPVGAVLTKEGTPGRECFILISGTAEVVLRGEHLADIGPGGVVGEMALLDVSPRSATVVATSDIEAFVLEPRSFDDLLERHPSVAKQMLTAMAQRVRELEDAPTY